ncbi:SDR family oxidoreductase [Providencia alcalifaciens]|uniref:DUF2867 domain-containing protein n=1 Tax=Providencia alcalifaciens TaxID=126385 RepID=UPI001CE14C20|nr:DUF2867 domain-containing protein [Providencia alcalifaciens]UBX48028.1 SDR family oxidoreductase [Providencia alcalifaciens]
MTGKQRVLVLGASGYIGQNLIPKLLEEGHKVTAAARRVDWMLSQGWSDTRCIYVDLHQPETLKNIMDEVDIVYFLVHSMADQANLIEREREAARNVQNALQGSNVKQVIYLSALQHGHTYSPHLIARRLTGEILRESGIPVTEIRASIIVGSGSAAFEIMRDMVYNLAILTPPRWVRSKSSPIALENILYYLTQLAQLPVTESRELDAGGPEYISYQELFKRFIKVSGKRRVLIPIPIPISMISVHFISLITSVPPTIAKELIQGLQHDLPADDKLIRELIPQTLISFDDAVRTTLAEEASAIDNSDWGYDPEVRKRWRPGYGYYPKQAGFTFSTTASTESLWHTVQQIGGKEGYFYANILWKTRAIMDDMMLNKVKYGRPDRDTLQVGDEVDGWRVINMEPNKQLSLLFGMKAPGLGRLTFTIHDSGNLRSIDVRAWWHPAGFSGLLYWFAMMPAHLFIFKGMAKRISELAIQRDKKLVAAPIAEDSSNKPE